jgi:phosphoglycerate dehydrogenase-like enzyme
MLRVGIEESVPQPLLALFPPEAEIVRIPHPLTTPLEVDLWILPFLRAGMKDTFAHLHGVRVVQAMTAGVDSILPWLPKEVTLCDGRGLHDISTSEWVLAAILAAIKRLPEYRDTQHLQQWKSAPSTDNFLAQLNASIPQYNVLGEDLHGKTVLIVGYGSIGAAIEARLTPFGVHILRLARSARTTPPVSPVTHLHTLLPQADIVILIVPSTSETHGMIAAPELALLRPGALLINAARGPVVDTAALLDALQHHRIRAVLDVTDPEPLPPGHPLWTAPNLFLTPHVGGSTPQLLTRAITFAAAQVRRYLANQPLENIVSDAGY